MKGRNLKNRQHDGISMRVYMSVRTLSINKSAETVTVMQELAGNALLEFHTDVAWRCPVSGSTQTAERGDKIIVTVI